MTQGKICLDLKTIQFNFDMRGNDLISDPSNGWM